MLCQGADPFGQAGNFARGRVPVQHALGHATVHFRFRLLERGFGGRLVAARDGDFHLLDEGPNTANPGTVDLGAARVTADPLLGGLMMGHGVDLRYR